MGAVSPAGVGVDALWCVASGGVALGERILSWDVSQNGSQIGSMVPKTDLGRMRTFSEEEPYIRYAVQAANEAWTHAGLAQADVDPSRAGVCIGSAVGGVVTMERAFRRSLVTPKTFRRLRYPEIDPRRVERKDYWGFLASSAGVAVARALKLKGLCLSPSTGCTAGLDSIGMAYDVILANRADYVVAGASDAPFTPITFTAFDNIKCLTQRNASPRTASRPFDRDRDGFLLGEGCGIVILEAAESAKARKARVLGRFLGYASLSNAHHMTALPVDGAPQARAIIAAMQRCDITPTDISYFNLHGTSTPQNDVSETSAVKKALGEAAFNIPMSSTKSVIGHALGAASALATVVCLRSMSAGIVAPTANLNKPGEGCDLDYTPIKARRKNVSVVGINASGFSGIHTTAFLRKE